MLRRSVDKIMSLVFFGWLFLEGLPKFATSIDYEDRLCRKSMFFPRAGLCCSEPNWKLSVNDLKAFETDGVRFHFAKGPVQTTVHCSQAVILR